MKLAVSVEELALRFDALSMRERILVLSASAVALVMIWTLAILDPIAAKQRALDGEKLFLQGQIAAAKSGVEAANTSDPMKVALAKERQAKAQLMAIEAQLANKSAGLIPPQRMVQVMHDVLSRQQGVRLVRLHNQPVASLAASALPARHNTEAPVTGQTPATEIGSGPFVHPIEIVVEGAYLDIVAYLRALESLEWRFYWKVLELETTRYPTNRVRIELSTLSMEKDWIGV